MSMSIEALDRFEELDGQRERQLNAEFDAAEVTDDEPMTDYEIQREAMRDAERGAYYSDLGVNL